jgi:hypothetical protein
MQLRNVAFAAVLSAVGFMSVACGEEETTEPTSLTCTTDANCVAGSEICHPDAKVCVQTCTQGSECPSSSGTCGPISETDTRTVCQCSTNAGCNTDREVADLICSLETAVCVPRCTSDAACGTGATCNTTTGECEGTTGGGQPEGATCSGEGRTTCSYGDFCSTSTCTAAPVAATDCENFPAGSRPAWDPATASGPVIYSVDFESYQANYQFCQASAPDAFIVSVRAYRTDVDWPSRRSGLQGFFYVNTGARQFDILAEGLLVPNTGYNRSTTNQKNAEFQVYLCRPANSNTIQPGFYFTGGNPVCSNITR